MDPLRFARLLVILALALSVPLAGCGDDSDEGDGNSDAGGDGDGDGDGDGTIRPRVTNDAGATPSTGEGMEGGPCAEAAECGDGLVCVANIFTVGVCARPCTGNADCNADEFERCVTYTGIEADAHCVNEVEEEYGICGVADTSICAGFRECLYFPDLPLGVCVDLCPFEGGGDGDGDGGTDDDAGVGSSDFPEGIVECKGDSVCLDILADSGGVGVCGDIVGRGEECGLDIGLYCEEGDFCRREDPENFDEPPLCRQNCTDTLECDEGTCTRLDLNTRVCI